MTNISVNIIKAPALRQLTLWQMETRQTYLLCQACSFFEGIKSNEKRSTWRKLVESTLVSPSQQGLSWTFYLKMPPPPVLSISFPCSVSFPHSICHFPACYWMYICLLLISLLERKFCEGRNLCLICYWWIPNIWNITWPTVGAQ